MNPFLGQNQIFHFFTIFSQVLHSYFLSHDFRAASAAGESCHWESKRLSSRVTTAETHQDPSVEKYRLAALASAAADSVAGNTGRGRLPSLSEIVEASNTEDPEPLVKPARGPLLDNLWNCI